MREIKGHVSCSVSLTMANQSAAFDAPRTRVSEAAECSEVVFLLAVGDPQSRRFHDALSPLGLRIAQLTPDQLRSESRIASLAGADVIVLSLDRHGSALQVAVRLWQVLAGDTPALLFVADGSLQASLLERAYALGTADVVEDPGAGPPLRARVSAILRSARRARRRAIDG